ncbi:putative lipid II flippase FtsW [Parenemella sanctibonifatiensis]|uniref:Probable peptidoglycan glycosyltransferase FtsW n=1 Tax=Parenemella sanctibonifatiensis TaxID=2016505 RepID=A0A255EFW6_9ACTN|nr:putative lipid II flippase FtsW [Parenemella sanctibonifatiensis]OYN88332.1 putative lipid II flippase FtsW [Parenemella sanctibonifatiensis]
MSAGEVTSARTGRTTEAAARRGTDQSSRGRGGFVSAALAKPLADYYLILGAAVLLLALGTMMVLSASSVFAMVNYGDAYYFVKRQLVFLVVGLVAMWWLSQSSVKRLRVLAWLALFAAIGLLILTFTPLGVNVNGNRNWVQFGTSLLRIQPSEFAKLAMIMWGADVLARKDKVLDQPKHLLFPYLPVAAVLTGLVVAQRDLGTALVMGAIMVGLLWVVGAPKRVLFGIGLVGAAGVAAMVIASPNRLRRILAFINPSEGELAGNYQALQGMYSLASGGWWGQGLGQSRGKWGSLVEAHTDFIFAVIGEELGLIGSVGVLALFLALIFGGLRVAQRSTDKFCRYAASGVTIWFGFQSLVNIAVVLRLVPVMGIPLPFLSYGGSALLANLLALGVLLACARNEPAARRAIQHARDPHRPRPKMTTVIGSRS